MERRREIYDNLVCAFSASSLSCRDIKQFILILSNSHFHSYQPRHARSTRSGEDVPLKNAQSRISLSRSFSGGISRENPALEPDDKMCNNGEDGALGRADGRRAF